MGRDVLGVAQTGTGKTAGFTLPMIDILSGSRARARMPRSLILEPTRELALQVAENFVQYGKYLKLNHALIIGGESMSDQRDLLNRGVDVLIATPGRLIDMFERGGLLLTDTRVLVIDEADRMLDMGFIPDVERIVSPAAAQPADAVLLGNDGAGNPPARRRVPAEPEADHRHPSRPSSRPTIIQKITLVAEHDKREALRRLIRSEDVQNALIFCNRKRDVDILLQVADPASISASARCTATWRSRCGSPRSRNSRPARSVCCAAAMSRRAASTSAASRTCSTSTCRSIPRTTCTASAAPAAPGARAAPSCWRRPTIGSRSRRSRN